MNILLSILGLQAINIVNIYKMMFYPLNYIIILCKLYTTVLGPRYKYPKVHARYKLRSGLCTTDMNYDETP